MSGAAPNPFARWGLQDVFWKRLLFVLQPLRNGGADKLRLCLGKSLGGRLQRGAQFLRHFQAHHFHSFHAEPVAAAIYFEKDC